MKKIILSVLSVMLLLGELKAQWPSHVTLIDMDTKDSVSVQGDLAQGAIIKDLSWASSGSNACFPSTQNTKFRGNHVLYATIMPPKSVMNIIVSPTDTQADLSLYGYLLGSTGYRVVPDLPSCITCEADHKWDRPVKNKIQTHERKIQFQNPTNNTYNVVIGVAGPKDVLQGQYNLIVLRKG